MKANMNAGKHAFRKPSSTSPAAGPFRLPGRCVSWLVWALSLTALGAEPRRPVDYVDLRLQSHSRMGLLPTGCLCASARHAGVHPYNDREDTLYASRSYLTLSADGTGEGVLRLQRLVTVIDPFTGNRLAAATRECASPWSDKETRILQVV